MFLSGVHNHGPAAGSEGGEAGGRGADVRTEGCTFTPWLLSRSGAMKSSGCGESFVLAFGHAGAEAAWRSPLLLCRGPFGAGMSS